nr:ribulose-phosphate 3-epimerase [Anaerolineae bacterium]
MSKKVKIAPSILSADFSHLAYDIAQVEAAGADQIHIDVMDGHFVPNISMGPIVVTAVRKSTRLPLDVHLMISDPLRYIEAFAKAGADALTIHLEADSPVSQTIQAIHSYGLKAGIAINPATPAKALQAILPEVDIILIMTVNPGFGGQVFIDGSVSKISTIYEMVVEANLTVDIAVDGGINNQTTLAAVAAGANVVVAGNAIFRSPMGAQAAVKTLRESILAR